jgi:cob(I)alamin adenosyltransferase
MKLYTKKGDRGETSLLGGTRVPKFHHRIESYGTVDELNAYLGLLSEQEILKEQRDFIRNIQHQLFNIGSILANDPEKSHFKLPELQEAEITRLEDSIDEMESKLQPLTNFVLPGGHSANAHAHVARTICRRAERRVVELNSYANVAPEIIQYLNRLSDWLFVLARFATHLAGAEEVKWEG